MRGGMSLIRRTKDRENKDVSQGAHADTNEGIEGAKVALADALAHPRTVVIKTLYAYLAELAV